ACDAPVPLYTLVALGLADEPAVQRAADHLTDLVNHNGWPCVAAPGLGHFRGPGRRGDPCPLATLQALKALALIPARRTGAAARKGVAMLLWHWEHQAECKFYLFGIGSDFRKLKYPFVWYDLLHVVDVLSHFPFVHGDRRFQEMLAAVMQQADDDGYYSAGSMYRDWQGWSFADKQAPSPWLTFLVLRIQARVNGSAGSIREPAAH
ncbi:MAG: hypothetical protein R3300_15985, partial [Candidatus Promineifilaceae bacterium]|nr:hypothetical protein [Candidatus Promineifilaceae bacterium]